MIQVADCVHVEGDETDRRSPAFFEPIRLDTWMECSICEKPHILHPVCSKYNWLNVHCDGRHMKL